MTMDKIQKQIQKYPEEVMKVTRATDRILKDIRKNDHIKDHTLPLFIPRINRILKQSTNLLNDMIVTMNSGIDGITKQIIIQECEEVKHEKDILLDLKQTIENSIKMVKESEKQANDAIMTNITKGIKNEKD